MPRSVGKAVLMAALATVPQAFDAQAAYRLGLNFGADEYQDSNSVMTGAGKLAATDVAGVTDVAQAHWNNLEGGTGSGASLVADKDGAAVNTSAAVAWESNNTWATTGRGEENNGFPTNSANYKLMLGYLDTGDPTTTTVSISGLPSDLTSGYDVYVYLLGGTGGNRGGGYRITDAAGTTLRDYVLGDAPVNPSGFVRDLGLSHDDKGNYLIFRGLTAASIVVSATTETPYGMVRAPINAVQLVAAPLDKTAPTVPANLAADQIGARRISLKWDAATDASGTVFYEVERDGTSVPKASNPTYVDSGLKAKSSHSYRVRALDDSGNASAWTAPLSVTTVDEVAFDGYLKFEYWTGMDSGTDLALLTDWIAAGNAPSLISYTPAMDSRPVFPNDTHEQYGAKISGFITPSESGSYRFFVRADDTAAVYLSTSTNEANAVLIAEESTACCEAFKEPDDTLAPNFETSLPQALQAGKRYAIYVAYKEGGGGDYVQVAWRKEGDTTPAASLPPIPSIYLSSMVDPVGGSVTILTPPAAVTVSEGTAATFSVSAQAKSPYVAEPAYQWFKNGTLIQDATSATYTTPELNLASDNGAKFKVAISVPGATTTSPEVAVTVVKDTVPPKITRVGAGSVEAVTLTFDEPLEKASAETSGNYTLSGGVTVSKAVLGGSLSNVVRLTTSPMTINSTYTVTVGGVKDRFNNSVPAGTQASFSAKVVTYADIILSDKPIAFYRFEETTGQKAINSGTFGAPGDGLWMQGAGPDDSVQTSVSSGEGPRPSEFLGFDPANRSARMTGTEGQLWVDTQHQFLNNLKAFSLEYWVKPANRVTDPAAFGTRIGLVGQNDAVEYGFINQTTVQIWSSGGGSLDTTYSFADGEWHHVATIADGKSIKNYYDGKLVGSGGSASTANYGSSTFNVHIGGGGVYDATGNFFTGEFDEVAIFDKAIPADRIAAHFKAGKEGGELPAGETPKFESVKLAGGNVTISWTGGGTLQESSKVESGYTDVSGATTPYSVPTAGGAKFYRLRQ